ncbi:MULTISPECIES: Na(+)/H(+) antiporter subunit B [unclassified Exiguobacterium]|uniref:Na(+)/H(+) antiporter subunit B n=1 Tax=unclassified Exiguobacterium TaxID=2644629 RepID=UPI0008C1CA05|nr:MULTISPECIES: Na(+)/H(+) antiporter subunit B [unclassified Exiguobacterium]OGX78236.1 cation:proton antiporter [Exiguobacterium sp. SH31]TCI45950.1 Na(+)/H(+) antiporter subunit B [Exiguobacterium sp. SH5S32]TCI51707.1 Na(+)/H(+) antiporter subunit B [Exiguobacterium sp. SH1S4]TCI53750.1 Na(+)/H(+) antiporter subunit B [Exiguobacterium sp. SH1S21]TCI71693.1 Na(+)/H(+) antiporter subunit B [Exiguobacterium sp. SH1S1]
MNRKNDQVNDVILQTAAVIIFFIIIMFSINLFFAGHYSPGGGFVGGLMTAAALVLLLLAFDSKTLAKVLPFDYRIMTALGLVIAMLTSLHSIFWDRPFLTHAYDKFDLPLLGEQTLHTAIAFDLGVYLVVIGVTMTIIQTIGESE